MVDQSVDLIFGATLDARAGFNISELLPITALRRNDRLLRASGTVLIISILRSIEKQGMVFDRTAKLCCQFTKTPTRRCHIYCQNSLLW